MTPGAVNLAKRTMTGRWFVVSGCAVTLAGNLLSLGYVTSAPSYFSGAAVALLGLLFPIVTLVLVTLPPTTAWINATPRRTNPY